MLDWIERHGRWASTAGPLTLQVYEVSKGGQWYWSTGPDSGRAETLSAAQECALAAVLGQLQQLDRWLRLTRVVNRPDLKGLASREIGLG